MAGNRNTIDRILETHGRTFAEEPGLEIALNAARALANNGWTTVPNMQNSSWRKEDAA